MLLTQNEINILNDVKSVLEPFKQAVAVLLGIIWKLGCTFSISIVKMNISLLIESILVSLQGVNTQQSIW